VLNNPLLTSSFPKFKFFTDRRRVLPDSREKEFGDPEKHVFKIVKSPLFGVFSSRPIFRIWIRQITNNFNKLL
jgi:hypothetical protein